MKRFLFINLLLFCFLSYNKAQDSASALWSLVQETQQEASINGQLEDPLFTLKGLVVNSYGGPEQSIRISHPDPSTTQWNTSESPDYYFEFSVTPKPATSFNVTSISFLAGSMGGGDMMASYYYSTDPDFATKTAIKTAANPVRDNLEEVKVTLDETIENGERIYLRIYPYYKSAATGKYICIKDVNIEGNTTSQEVPASVIWPFIQDIHPVTEGYLSPEDVVYGEKTRHYGWDARVQVEGVDVENGTITTTEGDCEWAVSEEPLEGVYLQFAVSPKYGATFTINQISLMIASTYTTDLVAAVYGSTNENFENAIELKSKSSIPNFELTTWTMDLDTPVEINDEETYYVRIYPFNGSSSVINQKLVGIRNVTISGMLLGNVIEVPEVTQTIDVDYISTTSVITGGNISNNGGSAITDYGIAYRTEDVEEYEYFSIGQEGIGLFTTTVTGLEAGTTYYICAYAANVTGIGYAPEEISFTTLSELVAPTVVTSGSTDVRNLSMIINGDVTEWGGTTVTEKGIIWGTDAELANNPTQINAGEDVGSFQVYIDGLTPETTYYARAYATNSTNTNYGEIISITTKATEPDVRKIIAQDGSGDYTTVQQAFDAVPTDYTGRWILQIKPGEYKERPVLAKGKVNVYLVGENPETTIITNDAYADTPKEGGGTLGTSGCQTMAIQADDFTAVNLTIENTHVNYSGVSGNHQAVALRTDSDRLSFYNCYLKGYQDTYYAYQRGRAYFKNCYISGSVDFIFGRQTVIFDQCTTYVNRDGGVITAPSTELDTKFGLIFLDCTLTSLAAGAKDFNGTSFKAFYLGRPWQKRPHAAFIRCELPSTLHANGWTTMNGGLSPIFVEYGNTGAGAATSRSNEGKIITADEASAYTIENIFKKETDPTFVSDWMPKSEPDDDLLEGVDKVCTKTIDNKYQSYNVPNPFVLSTTIKYTLSEAGEVSIKLLDINGVVINQTNEYQNAGENEIEFNTANLPAGIYFYSIQTEEGIETKRIMKI